MFMENLLKMNFCLSTDTCLSIAREGRVTPMRRFGYAPGAGQWNPAAIGFI
jgi:hypothetical protein